MDFYLANQELINNLIVAIVAALGGGTALYWGKYRPVVKDIVGLLDRIHTTNAQAQHIADNRFPKLAKVLKKHLTDVGRGDIPGSVQDGGE